MSFGQDAVGCIRIYEVAGSTTDIHIGIHIAYTNVDM